MQGERKGKEGERKERKGRGGRGEGEQEKQEEVCQTICSVNSRKADSRSPPQFVFEFKGMAMLARTLGRGWWTPAPWLCWHPALLLLAEISCSSSLPFRSMDFSKNFYCLRVHLSLPPLSFGRTGACSFVASLFYPFLVTLPLTSFAFPFFSLHVAARMMPAAPMMATRMLSSVRCMDHHCSLIHSSFLPISCLLCRHRASSVWTPRPATRAPRSWLAVSPLP